MKFATDDLKDQLAKCHPQLIAMLNDFEVWCEWKILPEPVITELIRTKAQQGQIYFRIWRDDAEKTLESKWASAGARQHAQNVLAMPDADLLALASKRFSWHIVHAAADIRTKHYTRAQLSEIENWFRKRCRAPIWELKLETHGTGPHVHIERRDYSWRKKVEAEHA